MQKKVDLIVVGAGARGHGYASYVLEHGEHARVIGVAEPRAIRRETMIREHAIQPEFVFNTWEELAQKPKMADAVLICTQDAMHEAPAIAFARLGYHILLEKPMAPTAESCRNIVRAVKEAGVLLAVCHVLRYTPFSRKLKEVIASGAIGEVVSLQHLEPVAHWHQSHSFVRGNWRNEKESSFMLLAKSCHDVDWISHVMDRPCKAVQSFGSLYHLNAANRPAGSADRCTNCPETIEKNCPYSALKIYLRDRFDKGLKQWPVNVLVDGEVTAEKLTDALKNGPYGRCVYACDNDVVDQQVVNMSFADGATASMTMTAFCNEGGRQTRIFGTRGWIQTDSRMIHVTDFLNGNTSSIDTDVVNDGGILSGHGGGDSGLMGCFIEALHTGDHSKILSGADKTLESHLMTFGAEDSRKKGEVVSLY